MKTRFEHEEGKIYLIVSQMVWTDDVEDNMIDIHREDITDKVMPVVDDSLDFNLGLHLYKMTDGKLKYIGK